MKRRNGLPQSCEPCRKSKLKCDHQSPICGRCASKNLDQYCVYHPAPMTRPRNNVSVRSTAGVSAAVQASQSAATAAPTAVAVAANLSIFSPTAAAESGVAPGIDHGDIPGYLGPTSYSAVLSENPNESDAWYERRVDRSNSAFRPNLDSIRSGAMVLRFLYDLSDILEVLIKRYYKTSQTAIVPPVLIFKAVASIQRTFGSLVSDTLEATLHGMSMRIHRSSSNQLEVQKSTTMDGYCAFFMGADMRWEMIGNLLVVAGIALLTYPDNDPLLIDKNGSQRDPRGFVARITEMTNSCLNFCREASPGNDMVICLQYNDSMLLSMRYGDSHYSVWRRLADLSGTVFAIGLHQHDANTDKLPFFLRQWRRMFFAASFYIDKIQATFLGRPFLINSRYCIMDLPLDLSDDDCTLDGEQLQSVLDKLDGNGWNSQGALHRATIVRLRFWLSTLREDILDLSLGTDHSTFQERYRRVSEKAITIWNSCPQQLCPDFDVWSVSPVYTGSFALFLTHVDYLYSLFLFHRTLVKRRQDGVDALLDTARKLLLACLKIIGERDQILQFNRNYSWTILSYGLPSASVLALELLRQTQQPGSGTLFTNRAELIRNLSVFISCLSWVVRPGDGNFDTCKEAERKLIQIVDQVLDPQPVHQGGFDPPIPSIDENAAAGLDDFLAWFDSDNLTWDLGTDIFSV